VGPLGVEFASFILLAEMAPDELPAALCRITRRTRRWGGRYSTENVEGFVVPERTDLIKK